MLKSGYNLNNEYQNGLEKCLMKINLLVNMQCGIAMPYSCIVLAEIGALLSAI